MTTLALLAITFLPYFETRNQVANYIIHPPVEQASSPAQLSKPDLTVRSACPVCEGKGELLLEEPDFGQNRGRLGSLKKTKKKCPVCRGTRRLESFVSPAELTLQVARDHEEFRANHQGKGDIAVGEAFVPHADYTAIDKGKKKLIAEAFGQPCARCHWTGLEACRKCKGQGLSACPEKDCKGGFLVTQSTTERTQARSSGGFSIGNNGWRSSSGSRARSTRETSTSVTVCPTCGGAKFVICPECGGRKALPCSKCNGIGLKQKAGTL